MGRNKSKWWPEAVDIIRQYPRYKRELLAIETDHIYCNDNPPHPDELKSKTNKTSDPTADRANKLFSDERAAYLRQAVAAVDFAIAIANTYPNADIRMRYIKLRYWDNRYTAYGVADTIHISCRTGDRINSEFVKNVAKKIGFL